MPKNTRGLSVALKYLALPLRDFFSAMEVCLTDGKAVCAVAIVLSSLISWWVYVPLHELLHALGCVLGGGRVDRLEISGIYGASALKKVFPFVSVGSDYSGRLTGFDTGGSDVTFLITDFMPYVLTILVGVPLLKSVSSLKSSSLIKSVCFGLAAPLAYAPFMSVFGDYYEMGSILITRLASQGTPRISPDRWRSDDLFRLIDRLSASGAHHAFDTIIIMSSLFTGVILIFSTYWAGALFARMLTGLKRKGTSENNGSQSPVG